MSLLLLFGSGSVQTPSGWQAADAVTPRRRPLDAGAVIHPLAAAPAPAGASATEGWQFADAPPVKKARGAAVADPYLAFAPAAQAATAAPDGWQAADEARPRPARRAPGGATEYQFAPAPAVTAEGARGEFPARPRARPAAGATHFADVLPALVPQLGPWGWSAEEPDVPPPKRAARAGFADAPVFPALAQLGPWGWSAEAAGAPTRKPAPRAGFADAPSAPRPFAPAPLAEWPATVARRRASAGEWLVPLFPALAQLGPWGWDALDRAAVRARRTDTGTAADALAPFAVAPFVAAEWPAPRAPRRAAPGTESGPLVAPAAAAPAPAPWGWVPVAPGEARRIRTAGGAAEVPFAVARLVPFVALAFPDATSPARRTGRELREWVPLAGERLAVALGWACAAPDTGRTRPRELGTAFVPVRAAPPAPAALGAFAHGEFVVRMPRRPGAPCDWWVPGWGAVPLAGTRFYVGGRGADGLTAAGRGTGGLTAGGRGAGGLTAGGRGSGAFGANGTAGGGFTADGSDGINDNGG